MKKELILKFLNIIKYKLKKIYKLNYFYAIK